MHELFYINQRKFYFNQLSNINLLKYEKKYKNQGPFYTNGKLSHVSVISEGACLALVLYLLSLYEKNIKFGVRYFYLSSEKVFKNKEALKKIMPEIYFWMGFQEFAFNDFYQKLNPNFFTHQELLNKKLQEHTHVKILRAQHCINENEFNLQDKKIKQEIEALINKKDPINNYFVNKYSSKNKSPIEIIHKVFILKNNLNWHYSASFVLYNTFDFKNKIFECTNNYINSSLCFSIGIDCKNSPIGHQICLIITPHIKDKFILFDPNFGLYTFHTVEGTVKAIFDFSKATFDEKNLENYKFYINLLLLAH